MYVIARFRPLDEEVRRIAGEQYDRIVAHLTSSDPPMERIHGARKRLKESRALMRLIRQPLGSWFSLENGWCRDAGRQLSGIRDAHVLGEALKKLEEWSGARFDVLLPESEGLHGNDEASLLLEGVAVARLRIRQWPEIPQRFRSVRGAVRTYDAGRRALEATKDAPSPAAFHELRKRVKDHWYHARLLEESCPSWKERIDALKELSDLLGDHHDLAVLRLAIDSGRIRPVGRTATTLPPAIEARAEALALAALPLAERLYAEPAEEVRRQLRADWQLPVTSDA